MFLITKENVNILSGLTALSLPNHFVLFIVYIVVKIYEFYITKHHKIVQRKNETKNFSYFIASQQTYLNHIGFFCRKVVSIVTKFLLKRF